MGMTWLADSDKETFWAHKSWRDFEGFEQKEKYLVIAPVYGFADHGLGLPLDVEETVGSALLKQTSSNAKDQISLLVLPPIRFCLAPYPSNFFGIDPETAHELIIEIARSLQAAGFRKMVFFSTSPWNEEFIDAASRDTRVALELQTFVINLSGLNLDLHPRGPDRAQVQALASYLLGKTPVPSTRQPDMADLDLRPGRFRQPESVVSEGNADGAKILATRANELTLLLAEVDARAPLGVRSSSKPSGFIPDFSVNPKTRNEISDPPLFPSGYRGRYLAAMTQDELWGLPDKQNALILITTGAIEQHGPHLPVGVDAIMGQAWLNATLPRLPADLPIFVGPAITFGKSNEHVGFPGTIWISAKTLRRILLAIAGELKRLGFRNLAIINTHGGNSSVLVYTVREIQETLGLRAGMINSGHKPDISEQESAYGFHAGEWETSAMMAVTDGLVKMEKAVCEFPARLTDPGKLRPENAPAIFSWITSDVSESGVMGDATLATAEKGKRWMDEASELLAHKIISLLPKS